MKPLFLASCLATGLLMIPGSAAASLPMVDGVGSYTHSRVMKHRSEATKGHAEPGCQEQSLSAFADARI